MLKMKSRELILRVSAPCLKMQKFHATNYREPNLQNGIRVCQWMIRSGRDGMSKRRRLDEDITCSRPGSEAG